MVLSQVIPYSPAYVADRALFQDLKKYEGLWGSLVGWVLSLFDYAVGVYDEQGQKKFYLNVRDLVRKLCDKIPGTDLSASKKLNRLVLETLNPRIGERVKAAAVTALFRDFRSSEFMHQMALLTEPEKGEELAAESLERLKTRHLEVIPCDKNLIMQKLKPGDILFKKMPHDTKNVVVLGQWAVQPLISGTKEREGYKYSHAAIYLGNGKVAEAVPNHEGSEVRILEIDDPRFAPDSTVQYVVSRSTDEELAKTAAEIAAKTAQEVGPADLKNPKETVFKYTKLQALRSIWHPSGFGPFARYRYLKQYHDDRANQLPKDFMDLKSFFCSYFVGYCYQTAESRKVIPELLGPEDAPPKGLTSFGTAICRGIWARVRRIQAWRQMSQKVELQFDAKRLTPQDFRNFMVGHQSGQKLFKDSAILISR